MAIASLILGIIAASLDATCFWLPIFGQIPSIGMGVVAIILGALGMKKNPLKVKQAKAGLILGIVAVALGIVILILSSIFLPDFYQKYGTGNYLPQYRSGCR
jgi:hypothetical protein